MRGIDALGNTGGATCQSFLVAYRFEGFQSPIDNALINSAKAGQAIPAKWRLTDANGVPIDSTTSFDRCRRRGRGRRQRLQYNGHGYWQFNLKTPKSYANTCRAMYITFDSDQTSPVVAFMFKK